MQFTHTLLLIAVFALAACNNQPAKAPSTSAPAATAMVKKLDVDAAKTLFAANDPNLQLVDLRTPEEVAATGTIRGARIMDFSAPDFSQQITNLDKQKPVVVYCAAGGRSGRAAKQLQDQGFQTVYDLAPGMNGWLEAGETTVKE